MGGVGHWKRIGTPPRDGGEKEQGNENEAEKRR